MQVGKIWPGRKNQRPRCVTGQRQPRDFTISIAYDKKLRRQETRDWITTSNFADDSAERHHHHHHDGDFPSAVHPWLPRADRDQASKRQTFVNPHSLAPTAQEG